MQFGIFDFDPLTRELRRKGVPVHLQAQPAQVLALLLEHAGEVVARDALRRAVWGSGTFVDFDRGLNYCIAQIRSALGDSADSPRYIRTIPKRGYQFIAPFERVAGTSVAQTPAVPVVASSHATRLRLLAVGLLIGLAVLGAYWLRSRPSAAPPPT